MPSTHKVTFASNGVQAHGYLAVPETGSGIGVVVIQEWWGVTDQVRRVTERFANEGFVALAPDLFGGKTTHDAREASKMMKELPIDQAVKDLSGALDYLLDHEAVTSQSIGVVGFCMGGGFVILLAAINGAKVGAAVPFYPVFRGDYGDLSGMRSPVLGIIAGDDAVTPIDEVRQLEETLKEQAGVEVEIEIFPGVDHAFFNDEMPTYDADKAEAAWEHTVKFLKSNLG